MTRDVRRARWTYRWVGATACVLAACNAAPGSTGSMANPGGAGRSVVEEVRLATDRSAAQQEVVTLPGGERMRRVSNPTGFNHVLVGKMGADGKPSVTCVDRAPAAESFHVGNKQQGDGQ